MARLSTLIPLLDAMEKHDRGVLTEGSIARALQMYTASNPRYQHCRFADLPRTQQCEVLALAEFVEG